SATSCWRASTETPATPATKARTIAPVTADGYAETPWAATPWSPANTTARTLAGGAGVASSLTKAHHTATSPSRPSAPSGMARAARRSRAALRASCEGGVSICPFSRDRHEPFLEGHQSGCGLAVESSRDHAVRRVLDLLPGGTSRVRRRAVGGDPPA